MQLEHIQSRARGGSDRVSNLCLACEPCNLAKGAQDVRAFLAYIPARLERILAQAKVPLKAATAVNATRWSLYERLKATGLPVEVGSGGRTKYNRARLALPKTHWLDAAAVGASTPERLHTAGVVPLLHYRHGTRAQTAVQRQCPGVSRKPSPAAQTLFRVSNGGSGAGRGP